MSNYEELAHRFFVHCTSLHDVDLLDLVDVEDVLAPGTDDLAVVLLRHLGQGALAVHKPGMGSKLIFR